MRTISYAMQIAIFGLPLLFYCMVFHDTRRESVEESSFTKKQSVMVAPTSPASPTSGVANGMLRLL